MHSTATQMVEAERKAELIKHLTKMHAFQLETQKFDYNYARGTLVKV